jgi:CRP/FNR family cyclic AMP-dependent transcriptional regulator
MADGVKNDLELLGDGEGFHDRLCSMIVEAPMFSDLTHTDVEAMSHYVRAYRIEKGKTLFKEGDKGTFMCIVLEGRIDILKENMAREQKKVATVRAGKSLGEMSLLDELPYSASAVVREDATLLMLTKMNFQKLMNEQPALGNLLLRQIARLMSLRLRQTTGILLDYLGDNQ